MADNETPRMPEGNKRPETDSASGGVDDLESRRKSLGAALDARTSAKAAGSKDGQAGGKTGFGTALKLSSEFVAGVLVGAGIGYLLDRFAGTAPWGMIVFLLLGFAAGVLNVLRSAGVVADPEARTQSGGTPGDKQE